MQRNYSMRRLIVFLGAKKSRLEFIHIIVNLKVLNHALLLTANKCYDACILLMLMLLYIFLSEICGKTTKNTPSKKKRGQLATPAERARVEDLIWELEVRTPIEDTATSQALLGRWALIYASEDPTRSSPFFWAFRCERRG